MIDSNSILATSDLNIGYKNGRSSAIVTQKNISIQLKRNELIALVGINGIGKSTLIRTLCGLQPPLSGTITINQQPLQTYTTTDLAKLVSVVLTDPIPESNLTVYELIALGRQPYTNWIDRLNLEDTSQINNAIALTELESLQHKKHTELSDGQLQKVLIARAIAQDTPLILLDEPTTHLDLSHNVSILKLLQKICLKSNKSILYSTHDINIAIKLAHQIIVFTEDEVIQNNPCELIQKGVFNNLFKNPDIVFNSEKGIFEIK